jgi:hypothetical protein
MSLGGSRESLPERKVRFADNPLETRTNGSMMSALACEC